MYACDHNVCMFVCVVGGGTCTMVFCSPYYRCVFVCVHVRVCLFTYGHVYVCM